ncbi:MAG: methyltransferase domain-containing protein [Planctomycetaceae bacterium]|nr:methyltransferase domain-containing protein [Planctomycetaceae bacterium]
MTETTYIHGTTQSEQARLATLNRLTNGPFIEFLGVTPGASVLEVGSGLGILAIEVAGAAPDVQVTGLERSPEQLVAAASHPRVTFVEGDAHKLPFADATFDLVYCRYLLEHVAEPGIAVAEMRRVTRPGGRVAVMENDTSLVRVDPPRPAFQAIWAALARYQWQLKGDAFIGRRLYRLLKDAGFEQIELSLQPEVHWSGSPHFRAWLENLAGNLDSARAGLVESGSCKAEQLAYAMDELRQLADRSDASGTFAWNRAMAVR